MIQSFRVAAALAFVAIPSVASAQVDTTARGLATQAKAAAAIAQNTAAAPATVTIYAKAYGVVADGVTANDTTLANAITAAATAASTYANAQFYEVVLPAGQIRITQPLVVMQPMTNVGFRLRGAGRNGTVILADFASTQPAPQFTVSSGGCSGVSLYPVIDYGALVAVRVLNGGTGCTSAPTATLVTYNASGSVVGSGATVTLTVASGAVTGGTVTAGGAGYAQDYAGDAMVVRGQNVQISDLQIISSTARAAANNGGTSAYPFFTINNGIRYEPVGATTQTMGLNTLQRVSVTGQPGHGINAARQEQWAVDQVLAYANGADGFFIHTQGGTAGSFGIADTLRQVRSISNAYRGLHVEGMSESSVIDSVVGVNLTAGTLPTGVNEEIYLYATLGWDMRVDVERNDGTAAGHFLINLNGWANKVSGLFRGGLAGVYSHSCLACSYDGISAYGNAADTTSLALEIDGGTNTAASAPYIGQIYLGNYVSNGFYSGNQFPYQGFYKGTLQFSGLKGSQYAASASSTYTPDPIGGGAYQTLTLTGNVTIANPANNAGGQVLRLILVQDATGSRTVSFGTSYVGANVGSLGTGAATKIGIIEFMYTTAGSRNVWVQTFWSGWL
ncbi:hypothetical protein [Novosphingobium sp. Fuku2-ISO-50]|uniref:hypothetical protein n=1 Tax=Novosphingobium sp. Fuku2-ISO-50 TaxID=1739114 RepID=UPI00076D9778|nr:hypothetical protein [Novosphingobium sp. Fuku2-ISO-50]KUR73337.1 hypothetical protein AQZ50_19265 [Novosphingobium sp. Fuku2-ISO-50]